MSRSSHLRIGLALLALTATAACGGESAAGSDTSSSAAGGVKVAAVLKTLSNPCWAAMEDGVNAGAAGSAATVEVQAATGESDLGEQTSILTNMSNGGYDCYAVAPISGTNLNQPLASISAGGKTVVNLDSAIDPAAAKAAGVEIATFISSNNVTAGRTAGQEMARLLGGKGKVAVIGGLPGDANSEARMKGFEEGAKAGGLTVVQKTTADWDRQKALNAADAILRARSDIGGIYAANDGMALGAAQAVRNENRTDVEVIGTDGSKDAVEAVKSGQLSATVSQYPYAIGQMGVEACAVAAKGGTLPARVDAPLRLITPDNVDKALASYPKPFFRYQDPFTSMLGK